jgi:hypothetical protein
MRLFLMNNLCGKLGSLKSAVRNHNNNKKFRFKNSSLV